MASEEGRDPYEDYVAIRKELEAFSPKLLTKPEIIVANKMDGTNAKENLKKFKEKIKNKEIYEISAIRNEGLDKVIDKLSSLTKTIEREELFADSVQESHVLYKFKEEKPFNDCRNNSFSPLAAGSTRNRNNPSLSEYRVYIVLVLTPAFWAIVRIEASV